MLSILEANYRGEKYPVYISDNATISEQEMRAILDAQIVDISACLTRIEDIQATADFIE